MENKLKILIVDDHPSMIEGYKIILTYNTLGLEIEITPAYNCETAYKLILKNQFEIDYDLAFIDYTLPPYLEKNINNGQDLAILVQKHLPNTKVVILTSHTEAILLYDIVKNVAPQGLLVKSDFSADELLVAFEKIMLKEIYYSATVKQSIKDVLDNSLVLDKVNRHLILLLSQGIKTKNLPSYLNLSVSSIEKRKLNIREHFNIENGRDEDIVREAKRLGLV